MSDKPDGGPAFPIAVSMFTERTNTGLTLRDWFAGQALANLNLQSHVAKPASEALAQSAYNIADAMIKERDK